MSKNITNRQQIKIWMQESNLETDEESISKMFELAMEGINKYDEITLRQAYCYAYIRFIQ